MPIRQVMDKQRRSIGFQEMAQGSVPQGVNYLLVIGIDEYTHCPRLYNAVKDAQAFADLLTEKYQFDVSHVKMLFNAQATQQSIYEAFKRLVQQVTPNDNLVVYFSGHGEFEADIEEGYWIPAEAALGFHGQYIPNSRIIKYLQSINSHHTFLVVDSCFSGAMFAHRKLDPKHRLEKDPSRWLLTSGRKEVVSDGKPGDHSPFADNLLYLLKNNADAGLSVTSLINYVVDVTIENAQQTPRGEPLNIQSHKGGQFFFHLKHDENRDWAAARELDTATGYQHFLRLYPNGQFAEEAIWQFAVKQDTIAAFMDYRDAYPQGINYQNALQQVTRLEDEETWGDARRRNTLTGFLSYLDNYPEGLYAKDAIEKINILRMEALAKERKREQKPDNDKAGATNEPPSKSATRNTISEKITKTGWFVLPITDLGKRAKLLKILFIAGGLITLILIILPFIGGPSVTGKMTDSFAKADSSLTKNQNEEVSAAMKETEAFNRAQKINTIPGWTGFLNNAAYKNASYRAEAQQTLQTLNKKTERLLNDAGVLVDIKQFKGARSHLDSVLKYDPDNIKAKKLYEKIK